MIVNDRLIRIFISSTFRDLMEERTYLVNRVFPVLHSLASQRHVMVVPIDLRWGITDDNDEKMTHSAKVVTQCLREIDNSHPFFIGITGQRYGWRPSAEELDKIDLSPSSLNRIKTCLNGRMSVTELEMQYAVWRNNQPVYASFYIKDCLPEEDSRDALEQLKCNIRSKADRHGYTVREFHTPKELGEYVTDDFKQLLDQLFPERDDTPIQRLHVTQRAFMDSRKRWYVALDNSFAQLDNFLDSNNNMMAVVGESGMGKSSLVANWLSGVIDEGKSMVVFHFVSISQDRSHYRNIIDHLLADICDLYDLPQPLISNDDSSSQDSAATALSNLCFSIPSDRPLLIVIDGLNQVVGGEDSWLLRWLPQTFPSKVHVLLTTTPERDIISSLKKRGCHFFQLRQLRREQRQVLVEKYLLAHGKRLSLKQLDQVVDHKCCVNTLVLRSVLDELISFGQFEHLEERIDFYLAMESNEDFFQRVLSRIEADFSDLPVSRVLALIAFSQKGMGENELQAIVGGIRPIEWSQFYCAISNLIITQTGLISFSHQMLHDAAIMRYGDLEQQTRESIIDYFKDIRQPLAYEELAHQYYTLRQLSDLYQLLRRFPVFEYLYTSNEHLLYIYWSLLHNENREGNWDSDDYVGFYCFRGLYPLTEGQAQIYHHLGLFYEKYFCHDIGWMKGNEYDLLSIEFFKRAYEIMRTKVGKDNYDTARFGLELGLKLMHVERYDEAQQYFDKGFSVLKEHRGAKHPVLADYYWQYGLALLERENVRDSKRELFDDDKPYDISLPMSYYEMAADIYKQQYGDDHPMYGNVLRYIGAAYNNVGQCEKALDFVGRALIIQQRCLSDRDMQLGLTFMLLGRIYRRMAYQHHDEDFIIRKKLEERDIYQAYEYYQKAHAVLVDALGSDHHSIIELNVIIHDEIMMYYLLDAEVFFDMMENARSKKQHEAAVKYAQWSLQLYMKYCQLSDSSPSDYEKIQKLEDFLS